MAYLLSQI